MANPYSDIYYILDGFGVRSPQHIHKIARKPGKQGKESLDIRKELFNRLLKLYDDVEQLPMPIRGISLCIDASTKKKIPEILIRKCLLFGETTTFLTKGSWSVQGPRKRGSSFSTDYDYVIPSAFIEFLLKYKFLIEDGLVLPLPKEVKSLTRSIQPLRQTAVANALPISLKNETLFAQLTESEEVTQPSRSGYANLLLPSLQNSSVEDIRNLRSELGDSFVAFHRQLKEQFQGASYVDSESVLLEMMKETDEQVRQLHSRINSVRKTRLFKGATILAGFTAAAVVALAPANLSGMVAGLFGSSTAMAGLAFLTDFQEKFSALHNHGFYFPWKIGFGLGKS